MKKHIQRKNAGVFRRLLGFVKPRAGFVAGIVAFALCQAGLALYIPIIIGDAVDMAVARGLVDLGGIRPLLIRISAATLVSASCGWLMNLCASRVAQGTVKDIRRALFDKFLRVPVSFIDSHPRGDLLSRITADVEKISDALIQGFASFFSGVVTIIGTIALMLWVSPAITLIVILVTPLSLFVAAFIAKRSFTLFRAQSETAGSLTGFAEEAVSAHDVVKTFCIEEDIAGSYARTNAELNRRGLRAQFISAITNPSTRFVNGLVYSAVGIFGSLAVIGGGFTVGRLSAFLSYANQYTKPFNEISGIVAELQAALACASRVFELLDEPEIDDSGDGRLPANGTSRAIGFDSVSFGYRPGKQVIHNVSFRVEPGKRLALVGPTGCGKTTLINLLMRFYDPDEGLITLDGVDIRSIPRDKLRSGVGMVLQDSWLFDGTIRDNIAFGRPGASDADVRAAAKAAYADSFIRRLPLGYDTVISGDDGLSAGQRQLLCIARMLLANPSALILDEATSSIDTRTELLIQRGIEKAMEGRTSIIIAHRLSTIRSADEIIVMREGRIVERGSHDQLIAARGAYYELSKAGGTVN